MSGELLLSSELLNEIRSFEEESTSKIDTAKQKGEEKLTKLKAASLEKVKRAKADAQEAQKKNSEDLLKKTEEDILKVKEVNKAAVADLQAKITAKKESAIQTFVKLVTSEK